MGQVSLWGNPQFSFFAACDGMANDLVMEEADPYSFLDFDALVDNATPIKLHEDSPILGPRAHPPQIETKLSDLQQIIDDAMDTVIDDQRENEKKEDNVVDDDDDVEKDLMQILLCRESSQLPI